MAVNGRQFGRSSKHTRPRRPVRGYHEGKMGRKLGLHGVLRLCCRPYLLGRLGLQDGLRRTMDPYLRYPWPNYLHDRLA